MPYGLFYNSKRLERWKQLVTGSPRDFESRQVTVRLDVKVPEGVRTQINEELYDMPLTKATLTGIVPELCNMRLRCNWCSEVCPLLDLLAAGETVFPGTIRYCGCPASSGCSGSHYRLEVTVNSIDKDESDYRKRILGTTSVDVPIRRGQRYLPVIMRATKKLEKCLAEQSFPVKPLWMPGITKYLTSRMATVGEYKKMRPETTIRFATTPDDFIRLGHYGESSCYRTGSEYDHSKVLIGLIPGSTVVLLERQGDVVGRCWGIVGQNGALFTNAYLYKMAAIKPGLIMLLEDYWGCQVVETSERPNELDSLDGCLYLNQDTMCLRKDGDSVVWRTGLSEAIRNGIDDYGSRESWCLDDPDNYGPGDDDDYI